MADDSINEETPKGDRKASDKVSNLETQKTSDTFLSEVNSIRTQANSFASKQSSGASGLNLFGSLELFDSSKSSKQESGLATTLQRDTSTLEQGNPVGKLDAPKLETQDNQTGKLDTQKPETLGNQTGKLDAPKPETQVTQTGKLDTQKPETLVAPGDHSIDPNKVELKQNASLTTGDAGNGGRYNEVKDENGNVIKRTFEDKDGRWEWQRNPDGSTTRTMHTNADNKTVTETWDPNGNLTLKKTEQNGLIERTQFDPATGRTIETSSNSRTGDRTYELKDKDGKILEWETRTKDGYSKGTFNPETGIGTYFDWDNHTGRGTQITYNEKEGTRDTRITNSAGDVIDRTHEDPRRIIREFRNDEGTITTSNTDKLTGKTTTGTRDHIPTTRLGREMEDRYFALGFSNSEMDNIVHMADKTDPSKRDRFIEAWDKYLNFRADSDSATIISGITGMASDLVGKGKDLSDLGEVLLKSLGIKNMETLLTFMKAASKFLTPVAAGAAFLEIYMYAKEGKSQQAFDAMIKLGLNLATLPIPVAGTILGKVYDMVRPEFLSEGQFPNLEILESTVKRKEEPLYTPESKFGREILDTYLKSGLAPYQLNAILKYADSVNGAEDSGLPGGNGRSFRQVIKDLVEKIRRGELKDVYLQ